MAYSMYLPLLCFLPYIAGISFGLKEDFVININTNGSYSISIQGNVWLRSAPTFFRSDGKEFSSADGSLKLMKTSVNTGQDLIGQWQSTDFLYLAGGQQVVASIYYYTPDPSIFTYNKPALPFILFKQGVANASAPSTDDVISGFPGFLVQETIIPLGYLSYGGDMFGDVSKKLGQWGTTSTSINSGIISGPLAIFDRVKTANMLILSPASSFMSQALRWQKGVQDGGTVYWGTMGGVESLPDFFETSTILFCSNQGINKGFVSWGQVMQRWYGRTYDFVKSDLTVNYLGYWTDNGAYYYYKTEKGKTYQDTIVDFSNYIQQSQIPFRYVQFDSWWYYKGVGNGVKTWESMDSVFPNGMQWLYNKTGLPVSAHNRYWASDTTYAKKNGGHYDFIVESMKAVPVEEGFWNDLFVESKKWGLVTYEQDWLNDEFSGLEAMLTQPGLGELWLNQMGNAAAKNGLTIQYCMADSREMLQSLTIPTVTQARASDDYHPGKEQWRIGISSLFAWAIGVAPFKDNFWTTTYQPGNPYGGTEPYTELNAVVATLSTGPVGPSDMIGALNKSIIMRSVNAEGLILKPSRPATAIDNMIRRLAWSDFEGPDGEVWSTYSDFGGKNKFGIVLAADLKGTYSMTPCMAGYQGFPASMVFTAKNPNNLQPLTDAHPLQISGCTKTDFCLYYVSPVLTFQNYTVLILGELDKWVPMSPQRVIDISIDSNDIKIQLAGAPEESVNFWFSVNRKAESFNCYISDSGRATLSFVNRGCLYQ